MTIDVVGSFLPPENLVDARRRFEAGAIGRQQLAQIENEAVDALVERQLQAGLSEITSGELRLSHWDKDFYFGLGGISKEYLDSGRIYQNVETSTDLLRVDGRISYNPGHPFFSDFSYLQQVAAGRAVCRQMLPSPASLYLELIDMTDGHPERIYPEPGSLMADISSAYNKTIRHFYDLGCRSIQLDDTACGLMCDGNYTKRLLQGGIDLVALHEDIISVINDSLRNLPSDMEISLYLSVGDTVVPEWEFVEYPDNIMPKILARADVGKFFMPFDTGNSSRFDVLRHVPAGKRVTLGLIEAHSPFPDKIDHIIAGIALAAKYIPLPLLSVSPKTGFKLSSYAARGLTYEDQWHKLARLKSAVAS